MKKTQMFTHFIPMSITVPPTPSMNTFPGDFESNILARKGGDICVFFCIFLTIFLDFSHF